MVFHRLKAERDRMELKLVRIIRDVVIIVLRRLDLRFASGSVDVQHQVKEKVLAGRINKSVAAVSSYETNDVFISSKELDENGERTRDSVLAPDIYYQLTEQGRRVFFSRISLEDIPGTQYEPYIFAALNSAKVMIVVGTSTENLNAVWVKNEWSRFLAMMRKDKTKLLIPCYRDMDPYDMPEQLTVLMSYDMSKIGFIQDLIRGVNKVLDADKPKEKETVHETVVVKNEGGANAQALLKRGNMALEDKKWDDAKGFLFGIFQPVEIRFHGDDPRGTFEFLFPRLCCPLQELFLCKFACSDMRKAFFVLTAVRRKYIVAFLSLCPHFRCPDHSAWLTVRPERTVAVVRSGVPSQCKIPAAVLTLAHFYVLSDALTNVKIYKLEHIRCIQHLGKIFIVYKLIGRSQWQKFIRQVSAGIDLVVRRQAFEVRLRT